MSVKCPCGPTSGHQLEFFEANCFQYGYEWFVKLVVRFSDLFCSISKCRSRRQIETAMLPTHLDMLLQANTEVDMLISEHYAHPNIMDGSDTEVVECDDDLSFRMSLYREELRQTITRISELTWESIRREASETYSEIRLTEDQVDMALTRLSFDLGMARKNFERRKNFESVSPQPDPMPGTDEMASELIADAECPFVVSASSKVLEEVDKQGG